MQQKLSGGRFTVSLKLVSKITSIIGSIIYLQLKQIVFWFSSFKCITEANVFYDIHIETGKILAFQASL